MLGNRAWILQRISSIKSPWSNYPNWVLGGHDKNSMAVIKRFLILMRLERRLFSSFKDPYTVLGVKKDANSNEIKKAYFELVKKYHPDTNKDPEAKTKFIEIQNAYEVHY